MIRPVWIASFSKIPRGGVCDACGEAFTSNNGHVRVSTEIYMVEWSYPEDEEKIHSFWLCDRHERLGTAARKAYRLHMREDCGPVRVRNDRNKRKRDQMLEDVRNENRITEMLASI